MFDLLKGFQTNLQKVSIEIDTLQQQSKSMNLKLKNRSVISHHDDSYQDFQKSIDELLEGIFITPAMIMKISEGEVNEFYIMHLNDLNRKMNYIKTKNPENIESIKDVGINTSLICYLRF